ncbi:MAG: hypothetical protein K9J32_08365 [Synechococcus lacustris]|nr:hypothetical protein [Synechococcus lacustris]
MARLRATSLLNHLDLDRMFSVSTAETKAELAITQAAADSAKKDAEEAQLTKEAGEAYYAWQDLITEAEAYVGDAATKQAMVKRADEAHDTYLAVLCRGA